MCGWGLVSETEQIKKTTTKFLKLIRIQILHCLTVKKITGYVTEKDFKCSHLNYCEFGTLV